ncbi:odorant receptor 46a-like [Bombus pyrosoma]|uniref:odorant receptor 46a-like n=1 Tax=Bombus pyrosoma TaxID=396416 RepID=UPI001CB9A756|nr:odorant receptor 46a-like [Bombus pyrosoma]
MVMLTVACMILFSFLTDFGDRKLAYKAWLPFNYSVSSCYYIAYAHQIIALIGTALLNVACDMLVCGLLVHVCGQQEILKHRVKKLKKESRPDIGKIVRFHDYLYGYVSMIQQKFQEIIGVQLLSSTFVVCFILYELSNAPVNSKYLQFVLYLTCMMTQVFFYCWYGNQLKLKSVEVANAIFEVDWISFDNSSKKSLINVMRRATKPIELTCAYIFTMDLKTFVDILKMSYSTYNLLMYSILSNRKNIIVITDMLESTPFQPETKEEIEIREKCERRARYIPRDITYHLTNRHRSNAFYYALLVESSVVVMSVLTLLGALYKGESHKLAFRMWLPWNHTSTATYSLIYSQQILIHAFNGLLHVACDSLIWTLLMFICNQIEIFGYRLRKIAQGTNDCKLCIRYHNLIYRFATMINEEFKLMIFIQFAVSTLTICMNLYILTGTNISLEMIVKIIMFSSCMLTQIYILCWYGNEVELKSLEISNMIFEIDWLALKETTKRDLLMIMMRARSPIQMTSVHVVTMNLKSFVILLKTSYSAYNLLQGM